LNYVKYNIILYNPFGQPLPGEFRLRFPRALPAAAPFSGKERIERTLPFIAFRAILAQPKSEIKVFLSFFPMGQRFARLCFIKHQYRNHRRDEYDYTEKLPECEPKHYVPHCRGVMPHEFPTESGGAVNSGCKRISHAAAVKFGSLENKAQKQKL
jgi:hypothetical protein